MTLIVELLAVAVFAWILHEPATSETTTSETIH